MASNGAQVLINKALTASEAGTSFNPPPFSNSFIGFIKVTGIHAATTVTGIIQHSPNGTDWFTLASFAAIAGAPGQEAVQITTSVFPNIRANITLAGATQQATVLCQVNYKER